MMRYKGLWLLLFIFCVMGKAGSAFAQETSNGLPSAPVQADIPFNGEKIEYDIYNLGLKVGQASLSFEGLTSISDFPQEPLDLIVFAAQSFNFFDEEKIYLDPVTFYPLMVERNLNIFGSREKITEYYDTIQGKVKVVKEAGGKIIEQIIEKAGKLDNIYCFIYRYRKKRGGKPGDSLEINLPTQDVEIVLLKTTTIKVSGEAYEAYYMKSKPSKYRIWFDVSPQKLPLRIDGAVGFGKTSLVMRNRSLDKEDCKGECDGS